MRKVILEFCNVNFIIILRYKCKNCKRTHRRYPKGVLPFKQHCSSLIQQCFDAFEIVKTMVTETSTQYRWIREYRSDSFLARAEAYLARNNQGLPCRLRSGTYYPLLSKFKNKIDNWLNKIIINMRLNLI